MAKMRMAATEQSYLRYPLNVLLGTSGSVRVLRELSRHGGELSVGVLALRTGLNPQTVRNTLAQARRTGMVEAVGQGRSQSHRLVRSHPLADVLASLYHAEDERVQAIFAGLREEAQELRPRPIAVWVYGSVARGRDTPESDLDLAVATATESVEPVLEAYRDRLAVLEERHRLTISVVGVSPADVHRLSGGDPWWREVSKEAIPVLGPPPAAVAERARPGVERHGPGRPQGARDGT